MRWQPARHCRWSAGRFHFSCVTGHSFVVDLRKSFAWTCGPPIDMKIKSSRSVYDQAGVDGKDGGNSG